jgi:hypothetical protein
MMNTLIISLLSIYRDQISNMMYTPIKAMTVEKTAAFSFRLANFAHTLVKSMVLGGTAKSPPKEVR